MNITVDMEGKTSIGNYLNTDENIDELSFSNGEKVTHIGIDFLGDFTFTNKTNHVKILDLSGLPNVTSIGRGFLSGCESLETITWPDTPTWNKQRKIYENKYDN